MKYANVQRGFTLIEMSIVLVIIGLIIGGILKGQELIETSRQKNVVAQIDQIRSGVNSFQDRFRAMPGDYTLSTTRLNPQAAVGDGDGIASAATSSTAPATMAALAAANKAADEEFQFWNHLAAAGLTTSNVSAATAATGFTGGGTDSPMPASAYPQTGLSMIYGTHPGATATDDSRVSHFIVLSRFGTTAIQTGAATGATSPQRAYQVDTKYDDGLPLSGALRTFGTTANCGAVGSDAYVFLYTANECELVFTLP
jgi:prepilin-type N-terminal cleavage/methylation domain-containing protein